jgi:hypothetical protein
MNFTSSKSGSVLQQKTKMIFQEKIWKKNILEFLPKRVFLALHDNSPPELFRVGGGVNSRPGFRMFENKIKQPNEKVLAVDLKNIFLYQFWFFVVEFPGHKKNLIIGRLHFFMTGFVPLTSVDVNLTDPLLFQNLPTNV